MQNLTLHVDGMSCGHCLTAVNQALQQLPGVEVESVSMGRADVRYDERAIDRARIEAAVTQAGYAATTAS